MKRRFGWLSLMTMRKSAQICMAPTRGPLAGSAINRQNPRMVRPQNKKLNCISGQLAPMTDMNSRTLQSNIPADKQGCVCAKKPVCLLEDVGTLQQLQRKSVSFSLIKTYFYFICIRVSGSIRGHIQFGSEKNGGFLS